MSNFPPKNICVFCGGKIATSPNMRNWTWAEHYSNGLVTMTRVVHRVCPDNYLEETCH